MNKTEIVDGWLDEKANADRKALSPEAAGPYRYIWLYWCQWLDKTYPNLTPKRGPGTLYLDARASDVQKFLAQGPTVNSTRVSVTAPISEITRRRYWSVINSIYEHAIKLKLTHRNPADDIAEFDRPPPEKSEGLVLARSHFEAIYQELPIGDTKLEVRDRAILLLLLEAALTPGEICDLEVGQVLRDPKNPNLLVLHIEGARHWQCRDFALNVLASTALQAWMTMRGEPEFSNQPAFVTKHDTKLAGRVLFHLVSKVIAASAKKAMLPMPVHVGAQVLRNTRIVLWLNDGLNQSEVVGLAGYKDAKSFRGLRRHIRLRVAIPSTLSLRK
jgi:integrase